MLWHLAALFLCIKSKNYHNLFKNYKCEKCRKIYVIVTISKNTGGYKIMKNIISKIYRGIFCMAMIAATVTVNSTCFFKLYQEELPEELGKLRKHE